MITELYSWSEFRHSIKQDERACTLLIGKTKEELIASFGLQYNDVNNNVWMYRLTNKISLFNPNYLYILFENNHVIRYKLKKHKRNRSILATYF